MAEASNEALSLKTSFGEVAAKGATVVLLIAIAAVGVLALREHTKRDGAERRIEFLLEQQNKLLHEQTAHLQTEIDDVRCIVSINVFVQQFPRGGIEWDLLPSHLHACYPDYAKKMPRKEIR